ncbi:hypothetical protein B0O99DRAFT_610706 [Bisporella sp. PMI_857]|nr:hypothetical protein B0O99DRAFT_612500 [Bisporella sp. PMI_857]KAH8600444.1 hypothetical protein B0O99DRAFT_610706 [Bisporella sp. PMI_857]
MSPSRTLPTFLAAEVAAHNTKESCYVTMGTRVFDVTDFVESHPGGGELVLEYGGKDVTQILKDEVSHDHSEAAYEILEESLVGFVVTDKVMDTAVKSTTPDQIIPLPPTKDGIQELKENGAAQGIFASTGMSSEADLSRETDATSDYQKHKFLDLNKPLILQVWFGGTRPRHYKGGESAPLFGNFLEPLTKTPWWVIPIVWLPPVMYGTYLAREGCSSLFEETSYWLLGLFLWTLVEYILHRFLFHLDKLRLVMPPTLFLALAWPFWKLAHTVFYWNWSIATAVFCGAYWRELKKYHLQHHYMDYENGFGVTSRFWDLIFGTELAPPPKRV